MRILGAAMVGGAWLAFATATGGCTTLLGDFAPAWDAGGIPDGSTLDSGKGPEDASTGDAIRPGDALAGDRGSDGDLDVASSACGQGCLGGTCDGGMCQAYVVAAGGPWFATDGASVVWSSSSNVFQVPVAGGNPVTLATAPASCAFPSYGAQIAVAAGRVAWIATCTGGGFYQALWSAASGLANSGAAGSNLASIGYAMTLNPAGTSAFVAEDTSTGSGVWSCPFGGSCAQILSATTQPPNGSHGDVLAATASAVLWADENASVFAYVQATQGIIATGQPSPKSVATDGVYVYWANRGSPPGILRAMISAPGVPQTVVAGANATWLSTDGVNVYFTDGTADVKYAPVGGGTTAVLHAGTSPGEVAAAGGGVFWTDGGDIYGIRFP